MTFNHAASVGVTAAGVAFLIGSIVMFALSGILYCACRRRYDDAMKKSAEIEKGAALKANRIAGLEPDKLEEYLVRGFARCLEFSSAADVSGRDPSAIEKLYAVAWIRFMDPVSGYLTPETAEAIIAMYGKEFISKICSAWFKIALQRGLIKRLVDRAVTSDEIIRQIPK